MKYNGNVQIKQISFLTENEYILKVNRPKNIEIKPGQFFMIKNTGNYPLLNRPISVSDYTQDLIEFGIKIVGKETKSIAEMAVGDELYLLGPLGNGFDLKKGYNRVLLIGGGIGIEPLKAANRLLHERGCKTTVLLGYNDVCYDTPGFKAYADDFYSYSEKPGKGDRTGYPTQDLETLLSSKSYDAILSCGPHILMKKVQSLGKAYKVETQLLLEEKMACGIGACLGCTCETKNGYKKVCTDGPMFYGSEVDLNA